MSYGDVHGIPIDHWRESKKETITYTYDCLYEMSPIHREKIDRDNTIDQIKVPYDTIKMEYKSRGNKFLNYTLKKLCYELKKDKEKVIGIQNLKLVYLNLDGEEEVLLDTSEGKYNYEKNNIIEFEDGEAIELLLVYVDEKGLCGLDITTNKNESRVIGNNNTTARRVLEENGYEDKVVIGLGCTANEQYGISSIFFYVVDKITFSIAQTYGIRQLRAKIKANESYKNELIELKNKLNNEQKLLSDVANLPDAVFFSVLKYVMPY